MAELVRDIIDAMPVTVSPQGSVVGVVTRLHVLGARGR
jgi:hypothetical protein